jgi:hypothetical protein
MGYLKEKSAIQIARKLGGRQKNFSGEHFWARAYFVSTVGLVFVELCLAQGVCIPEPHYLDNMFHRTSLACEPATRLRVTNDLEMEIRAD